MPPQKHQKSTFGRVNRRSSWEKTHRRRSGWRDLDQSGNSSGISKMCRKISDFMKIAKMQRPYDSAPRPQMSNGVQRLGQRAPLGHFPNENFRRFSRRIPPPRSAKSGNTTITHVWRTQCSLCCNGGTARAGSRRNSGFSEIFSVFLSPIITAGEFLRNPPGSSNSQGDGGE